MELRLSALSPGEHAYIRHIGGKPDMVERLEDLGMVPGTQINCELVSPAGDPAAYRIRGTLIALRRRDADSVLVISSNRQERVEKWT